jgi:hypothetical protein
MLQTALLAATLAVISGAAGAQFVKGNEAVDVMSDGTKRVQTPPIPKSGPAANSKPCVAAAGCLAGPWHMVETPDGLVECTEPFARPATCRESTYGSKQMSRLWVVKKGSVWLWCQYPDLSSKCVDMNARPPSNLPYSAVQ